jgi:hypothetical protein
MWDYLAFKMNFEHAYRVNVFGMAFNCNLFACSASPASGKDSAAQFAA